MVECKHPAQEQDIFRKAAPEEKMNVVSKVLEELRMLYAKCKTVQNALFIMSTVTSVIIIVFHWTAKMGRYDDMPYTDYVRYLSVAVLFFIAACICMMPYYFGKKDTSRILDGDFQTTDCYIKSVDPEIFFNTGTAVVCLRDNPEKQVQVSVPMEIVMENETNKNKLYLLVCCRTKTKQHYWLFEKEELEHVQCI